MFALKKLFLIVFDGDTRRLRDKFWLQSESRSSWLFRCGIVILESRWRTRAFPIVIDAEHEPVLRAWLSAHVPRFSIIWFFKNVILHTKKTCRIAQYRKGIHDNYFYNPIWRSSELKINSDLSQIQIFIIEHNFGKILS